MAAMKLGPSSSPKCSGEAQGGLSLGLNEPILLRLSNVPMVPLDLMLQADCRGLGLFTAAERRLKTSLASGLSSAFEALHATIMSLTSSGHSSGQLQSMKT